MNTKEKEIILNYLKNNLDNIKINIHNRIDFFKIGTDLGFDINDANYKNHGINILAITIIDETGKIIKGQKSNKLIIYHSNLQQLEIDFIIAYAIISYILYKQTNQNELLKMSDIYTRNYLDESISKLAKMFLNPETFINSAIDVIPKTKVILKPIQTRMVSEKLSFQHCLKKNNSR